MTDLSNGEWEIIKEHILVAKDGGHTAQAHLSPDPQCKMRSLIGRKSCRLVFAQRRADWYWKKRLHGLGKPVRRVKITSN